MKVYIMRGLPGAGKSTWIKQALPDGTPVFSADAFFVGSDGKYRFDPAQVQAAHNKCFNDFLASFSTLKCSGLRLSVAVDNTNTAVWEIAPYVRVCEAKDVPYEIVHVECSPLIASRRNVHGVPHEVVFRMYQNLMTERLPSWWKVRVVWGLDEE